MHAFVSYARADLPAVEKLRDGLRLMDCQVWMDLQAGGGRDWWAAILQNIRDCDLFVAVLSPAGLESLACTREHEYAADLGKPILPVQVATISPKILPRTLARLNIVDFREPETFATGVRLTTAVRDAPAAPPLPHPLPPEPDIPLSYLAELGEFVRARSLTFNDQMAAASRLREALTRPEDHEDALVLIRVFAEREDLYARVHAQIQDLVTMARRPARRERFSPTGAEVRLVLTGHTETIWEFAFSADGSLLATVSDDGTTRLWDPGTGHQVRFLKGHTGGVNGVAFSPNGTLLATTSDDNTVRLWDPATGRHIRTLTGHTASVYGIAFSPDGTLLGTGSGDKTGRLWNPATGQHISTLNGHTGMVGSLQFSPDGTIVATSSADKTSRLWNPTTGQHIRTLTGHTSSVYRVAFSPDGTLLGTSSGDKTVRLWNPTTGQHIRTLSGHTDKVGSLQFSPDGTIVATSSTDKTCRLWNRATGEHIRTLEGHTGSVECVAFSPDGLLLASGGVDRTVRLWG